LFGENSENGGEASASKQVLMPVAGKLVDGCSVKGAEVGDGLSGNVLVCFRTVMISEARQY